LWIYSYTTFTFFRVRTLLALIQRVSEASVSVAGAPIAAIGPGILALIAVEHDDAERDSARMADRLLKFRLFSDANGRMNLNVGAVHGEILLVPQFTLAADTASGHRPSFSGSAPPDRARALFERLAGEIRGHGQPVATGRFGADMQVALVNDGPVTFWITVKPSGS
jgi:D-tyrosyl-tRNA(Tyr) deacylase